MSLPASSQYVTGGTTTYRWYDGRKTARIRERVAFNGTAPFAALTQKWPARSRIVWAAMNNPQSLTPMAASSAAASNVAIMGVALVYTAPTSLATNSATSNILLSGVQSAFGAAITAGGALSRGFSQFAITTAGGLTATSAQHQLDNKSTSDNTLYIVPYASTVATDANGVGRFYVAGTSTGTTQYTLNGTATATVYMNVDVQVEIYDDPPAA